MTAEEYEQRIYRCERYVNRLAFLCPDECRARFGRGAWAHHGNAMIAALTEAIDAEFYGMERPPIATGIAHLDADIARHLAWFDQRWRDDGKE